jgi:hypothetical protein
MSKIIFKKELERLKKPIGNKAKDFSKKSLKIFNKQTSSLSKTRAKEIIQEGIRFIVNRNR